MPNISISSALNGFISSSKQWLGSSAHVICPPAGVKVSENAENCRGSRFHAQDLKIPVAHKPITYQGSRKANSNPCNSGSTISLCLAVKGLVDFLSV
jgi:hypothetical protein